MEVHTCLYNDVQAFDFSETDLNPARTELSGAKMISHSSPESFLSQAETADYLLTWEFKAEWYARCPNLKAILTPAAGRDWIEPDPSGQVEVLHGSFHGSILAESLLGAILYMNHAGPGMTANFQHRGWNRNLQTNTRLLANQTIVIVGYGNIGAVCGTLISQTGAKVIGVRQSTGDNSGAIPVLGVEQLDEVLPQADHVVLLLPGDGRTDAFFNERRIRQCKPGVVLYNFGRGNALTSNDIIATQDHIGGAYLDVTDVEPLPEASPLWNLGNIMITPHSSCVYQEYKAYFLAEATEKLKVFLE